MQFDILKLYVNSGFIIANKGRFNSLLNPRFNFNSSLVITHELLISLPAAAIVKITPTGKASIGSISFALKRHGSSVDFAPTAIV